MFLQLPPLLSCMSFLGIFSSMTFLKTLFSMHVQLFVFCPVCPIHPTDGFGLWALPYSILIFNLGPPAFIDHGGTSP